MANIARLKELLEDVVPFIPTDRLDMSDYSTANLRPGTCGTSACVAGWAAVHPAFKRQGLRWSRMYAIPLYGRNGDEHEFFGVNEEEWDHIFGPWHGNDPVEAACRIIDVIEANTP